MISTIQHRRIFASRGSGSGGSGSGTGFSGVVNTYSDLPAASSSAGEFYYVRNSQGTSWLPGSIGGTYYPSGVYYSTGTDWITGVSPWQATQAEVDAGVLDNVFVSPLTLKNAAQWNAFSLTQGITQINSGIDQGILYQSGTTLKQSNIFKFDEATGRLNINNVTSPTAQINVKATSVLSSDYFLRLRDSTESYDIISISNDGTIKSRGDTATSEWYLANGNIATQVGISGGRGYMIVHGAFSASNNASNNVASAAVNGNTKAKFYIGAANGNSNLPNEASSNIMFIRTGVNPALNWSLGYQQYSATNGTFHYPAFMLSDGKVVKLEPQDSSSIATLTDLINALKNTGHLY